jgi:hypothetical protein
MINLIIGVLVTSIFYPQPILAESLDKNKIQFTSLRVDRGQEVKYIYGNRIYKIYATHCGEIINNSIESDYIILSPGEPVELKDKSGDILILYSLPCN